MGKLGFIATGMFPKKGNYTGMLCSTYIICCFCKTGVTKGLIKLWLGCSLALFCFFTSYAQSSSNTQPFVRKFDERDGLLSPDCTEMLTDEKGNIWIGSFESVSVFNGLTFKGFNKENGLDCSAVYNIEKDEADAIYVLTDNGIHRYTGDYLKPFEKVMPTPDSVREDMLALTGNRFWLAGGVVGGLFLAENGKLKRYFSNNHFNYLARSKQGLVYALSTEHNIYVLRDTVLLGIIKAPPVPGINIYLDADYNGQVWYSNGRGLYQLNGLNIKAFLLWPPNTGGYAFHIGQHTGAIYLPGTIVYKYQNEKWWPLYKSESTLFDVLEDENGTLWLGTNDKGLYRIQPNPVITLDSSQLLPFIQIKEQFYLQTNKLRSLLHKSVTGHQYVFSSTNKMQWNCTDNGLYYRQDSSHLFKRYVADDTTLINSNDHLFLKAVNDNSGKTWFSSYNGIDCYSNQTFQHFNTSKGLFAKAVYDIATDKNGQVYAGATGLYVQEQGRFYTILKPQMGNNIVWSLCADPTGKMWAMNLSGKLYCVERRNTGYVASDSIIVTINHLPAISRGMGFDQYGNLWFATRQYFFVYAADKQGRYNSNKRLVLPAWNEEPVKMVCGTDGNMYLYNRSGSFAKVNTDSALQAAQTMPAVSSPYLVSVQVANTPGHPLDSAIYASTTAFQHTLQHLAYWQNDLRFQFSVSTLAYPDFIRYRFKLDGYDDTWREVPVYGIFTYNDLPAGNYHLQAQAADLRQQWSPSVFYSFTILTPWYRQWWAYLLFVAGITGFAILIFRWGTQVSRRREAIKHLLVEQQLKAIRAQINPHFLHNIFAFLAQKTQYNGATAANALETLSRYIREVLYATDKSVVSLEEELIFSEKYLEIQQLLLPGTFEYEIQVEDSVDTIGIIVPSMLLQPILENACKYGIDVTATHSCICIKITQTGPYVCCAIADTGSIQKKEIPSAGYTSKGMVLTKERLALLYKGKKNQFKIEQEKNSSGGTTVCIFLPMF